MHVEMHIRVHIHVHTVCVCVCALIYHNLSPSTEETPRFSRTALLLAVHGSTCIHTCVWVGVRGGLKGACILACGHAYTLTHTCPHIYMCVCVYVFVCVCVCACALVYHNLSPSTEETPRFFRRALL